MKLREIAETASLTLKKKMKAYEAFRRSVCKQQAVFVDMQKKEMRQAADAAKSLAMAPEEVKAA